MFTWYSNHYNMKIYFWITSFIFVFAVSPAIAVNNIQPQQNNKEELKIKQKHNPEPIQNNNKGFLKKIKTAFAEISMFWLVILAIFVPPLCVYLYDDKKKFPIFWITLSLCIAGIVTKIIAILASIFVLGIFIYVFWFFAIALAIANLFDIFI